MSRSPEIHCRYCHQTFLTSPEAIRAQKCDLCQKDGGLVAPEADPRRQQSQPSGQPHVTPQTALQASATSERRVKSFFCPNCGGREYIKVPALARTSLTRDRCCTQCGTSYVPPAPLWISLAVLAILLAIPIGILLDARNPGDVGGAIWLAIALGFPAVLAILVRVLRQASESQRWRDKGTPHSS